MTGATADAALDATMPADAPEPAAEAAADPPPPQDTDPGPEAAGGHDGPGREAARYRTRLREAEAERDALAGQLEALRRQLVDDLAGRVLARPGDLFVLGGVELADLLGEDGAVDPARVDAATEALLAERPELRRKRFAGTADGGPVPSARPVGWGDVLRRR